MENHGIFITGGTGFLGSEIISELIGAADAKIFVLVRAEIKNAAAHRLHSLWYGKTHEL